MRNGEMEYTGEGWVGLWMFREWRYPCSSLGTLNIA